MSLLLRWSKQRAGRPFVARRVRVRSSVSEPAELIVATQATQQVPKHADYNLLPHSPSAQVTSNAARSLLMLTTISFPFPPCTGPSEQGMPPHPLRRLPSCLPLCSLLLLLLLLLSSSTSPHVVLGFSFLRMSTTSPLQGRVALVTGASRGIGRGIAFELASAGATVYATARSLGDKECTEATLGGTLASLVNEAQAAVATGGRIIPLRCDHSQDTQVHAVLAHIKEKEGSLHYLVNNAFALPASGTEGMVGVPFWEQGTEVGGKKKADPL